jgi:hypothetical protein
MEAGLGTISWSWVEVRLEDREAKLQILDIKAKYKGNCIFFILHSVGFAPQNAE